MGLDGGTIISRSDVLRGSSWNVANRDPERRSTRGGQVDEGYVATKEEANAKDLLEAKWSCCALTGEPLRHEIVACSLGRLYNRESLIEFLLGKNQIFENDEAEWRYKNQLLSGIDLSHIKSLKDVFSVHLCLDSSLPQNASSSAKRPLPSHESISALDRPITIEDWICPITGQNPGIHTTFSIIKSCGHHFSSKALRELKFPTCPSCNESYSIEEDVIPLNGSKEQIAELQLKFKKQKKEKKQTTVKNKKQKSILEK